MTDLAYGGPNVVGSLGATPTNLIQMQAGSTYTPPAGQFRLELGQYTTVQRLDQISGQWVPVVTSPLQNGITRFDGFNYRLANTSGCMIGVLVTNGGSGYNNGVTCTASAGGASLNPIVGGAVNTSVSIPYGGNGYLYPPVVVIQAPPPGGLQATATATISGGVVTAITIVDQGAGYYGPPTITIVPDMRDTAGGGATAVATLTGAGTITGVIVNNHGTPVTSIPTLTFSGGGGSGAAATALMNMAITGIAVTTAGAGYTAAAGNVTLSPTPAPVLTAGAYANDTYKWRRYLRPAKIVVPSSGSGALSATNAVILDGGSYQQQPATGDIVILGGSGIVTTAAVVTLTLGGGSDTAYIM